MKNYAFIFARGGSKGLPGKNLKYLAEKPLLQYSIDIAFASPSIDKVFVSTEDADIAKYAVDSGAILINRPVNLATDSSSEWLAWRHAVRWVKENYGDFDKFISLPATSPLREVVDVEAAIKQLNLTESDICISITQASQSPFFNMVKSIPNGLVELVNKTNFDVTRRQDAPVVFDITTVVYVTSPKFILNNHGLFSGKVTSIQVPKERAIDIDDIYDFRLAEAILKERG